MTAAPPTPRNAASGPMDGVEFGARACHLSATGTLVVADLHVGRAAASNVAFPLGERDDLTDRLVDALDRFDPETVVVAGDYLHAFGDVPAPVPETVAAVEERVADAGADLVVAPGNHDGALAAVSDAPRRPAVAVGDAVVCHGHEEPDAAAERYVVGHVHPAISVEGDRRPCFLVGEGAYRGADVVVLPAFSRLAPGTLVGGLRRGREGAFSPLLEDVDAFRPVVVTGDGDPLWFPPLSELGSFL